MNCRRHRALTARRQIHRKLTAVCNLWCHRTTYCSVQCSEHGWSTEQARPTSFKENTHKGVTN